MKTKELADSFEESVRLLEELDFLTECHQDEVLLEILGEVIQAVKHNIEQIVKEVQETKLNENNYN
jgi:hypothetical protein